MPSLVFEFDDGSRIVAPITGRATVGSGQDNDIVAEREDVSAHHAEIFLADDGSAWLRDLGSGSGTFINGGRIQSHRLTPGDRVAFGSVAALFSGEPAEDHRADAAEAALRELESKLDEARSRHEVLLKSIAEASDRSNMVNDRVQMVSEQERTKLEHMERLHRDMADLEAGHARTRAEKDELESKLAEARSRHEALLKSVAEASDRSHMLSDRVQILSKQERTKLEHMERLHRDVAELEAAHARTRAESDELEKKRAALKDEVMALASREAAARAGTEEVEKDRAAAKDALAAAAARLEAAESALAETQARNAAAQGELDAAKGEQEQSEKDAEANAARAKNAREEVEKHATTKEQLVQLNVDLQRQVDETSCRLADLSGTEERLLKARSNLDETQAAHDALTEALAGATTQRDATHEESTRLAAYLDELREQYSWFEKAIPSVHEQHAQAERQLRDFEAASDKSREAWNAKIAGLQQSAAREQTGLSIVRQEVESARALLAGLEARSRELEAATAGLNAIQARLGEATSEKAKLDDLLGKLKKSCAETKDSLAALESSEKDATHRLSGLRATESDLLKTLQKLSADQRRERTRFEQLKKTSDAAEKEGARKKAELDAQISELHAEVAGLESRLAHAREWNEELDQRYARLAAMTDDSPEGLALWKETQTRRREIVEQLPTGIQVRAPGRTRVVPRGR